MWLSALKSKKKECVAFATHSFFLGFGVFFKLLCILRGDGMLAVSGPFVKTCRIFRQIIPGGIMGLPLRVLFGKLPVLIADLLTGF